MATKEQLTRQIKKHLDGHKIKYEITEYPRVIIFQIQSSIEGPLSPIRELILASESRIETIAVAPVIPKEENYANVVEFLTRVNCGMNMGGFEFDYKDGTIRFRAARVVHGKENTTKDLDDMVFMPFGMMQRYGEGIMKSIMGEGSPEENAARADGAK